jgi:hypothetical protein
MCKNTLIIIDNCCVSIQDFESTGDLLILDNGHVSDLETMPDCKVVDLFSSRFKDILAKVENEYNSIYTDRLTRSVEVTLNLNQFIDVAFAIHSDKFFQKELEKYLLISKLKTKYNNVIVYRALDQVLSNKPGLDYFKRLSVMGVTYKCIGKVSVLSKFMRNFKLIAKLLCYFLLTVIFSFCGLTKKEFEKKLIVCSSPQDLTFRNRHYSYGNGTEVRLFEFLGLLSVSKIVFSLEFIKASIYLLRHLDFFQMFTFEARLRFIFMYWRYCFVKAHFREYGACIEDVCFFTTDIASRSVLDGCVNSQNTYRPHGVQVSWHERVDWNFDRLYYSPLFQDHYISYSKNMKCNSYIGEYLSLLTGMFTITNSEVMDKNIYVILPRFISLNFLDFIPQKAENVTFVLHPRCSRAAKATYHKVAQDIGVDSVVTGYKDLNISQADVVLTYNSSVIFDLLSLLSAVNLIIFPVDLNLGLSPYKNNPFSKVPVGTQIKLEAVRNVPSL